MLYDNVMKKVYLNFIFYIEINDKNDMQFFNSFL